jgi:hypothetical protein
MVPYICGLCKTGDIKLFGALDNRAATRYTCYTCLRLNGVTSIGDFASLAANETSEFYPAPKRGLAEEWEQLPLFGPGQEITDAGLWVNLICRLAILWRRSCQETDYGWTYLDASWAMYLWRCVYAPHKGESFSRVPMQYLHWWDSTLAEKAKYERHALDYSDHIAVSIIWGPYIPASAKGREEGIWMHRTAFGKHYRGKK